MINLIITIIGVALEILKSQQVGGATVATADKLLEIISAAKVAYEKEVGEPLDMDKIKPYEPIE